MKARNCFKNQISDAITRCAKQGFYVLFISKYSLANKFVEIELQYATSQGAKIIPIVVGNVVLPKQLDDWLRPYIRVPEQPSRADLENIVKTIDFVMLKKISQ